jgi:uncharacterized integral membrane protein
MSAFTLFALVLLVAVTVFALSNPTVVTLRFLLWQIEASVALAVIGGAVFGGLLVFISGLVGQQHLRTRLRDLQARLREMETRTPGSGGHATPPS